MDRDEEKSPKPETRKYVAESSLDCEVKNQPFNEKSPRALKRTYMRGKKIIQSIKA